MEKGRNMLNVSSLLHHFTTYIVVKHDTRFKHTRFELDKPLMKEYLKSTN